MVFVASLGFPRFLASSWCAISVQLKTKHWLDWVWWANSLWESPGLLNFWPRCTKCLPIHGLSLVEVLHSFANRPLIGLINFCIFYIQTQRRMCIQDALQNDEILIYLCYFVCSKVDGSATQILSAIQSIPIVACTVLSMYILIKRKLWAGTWSWYLIKRNSCIQITYQHNWTLGQPTCLWYSDFHCQKLLLMYNACGVCYIPRIQIVLVLLEMRFFFQIADQRILEILSRRTSRW